MRGLAIDSRPWIRAGFAPPVGELYRNAGGTAQSINLSGFTQFGDRALLTVYDALGPASGSVTISQFGLSVSSGLLYAYATNLSPTDWRVVAVSAGGSGVTFNMSNSATMGRHIILTSTLGSITSVVAVADMGTAQTSAISGGGMPTAPPLQLRATTAGTVDPLAAIAFARPFTTDADRDAVMREALRIVTERGL